MNTYKITNVTNLAGKRDSKYNMALDIEYIDNRTKKTITLKAGDSVYLTVGSLPLSVHRLRIKNLIVITEVSAAELQKSMEKTKSTKKVVEKKKESVVKKKESNEMEIDQSSETETEFNTEKKRTTKKKSLDE